jgi:hypothetical protein
MNSPVAERGPNVISEMTQPLRMTNNGVRHAMDETPDARAALSDIACFPEKLAARCRNG